MESIRPREPTPGIYPASLYAIKETESRPLSLLCISNREDFVLIYKDVHDLMFGR